MHERIFFGRCEYLRNLREVELPITRETELVERAHDPIVWIHSAWLQCRDSQIAIAYPIRAIFHRATPSRTFSGRLFTFISLSSANTCYVILAAQKKFADKQPYVKQSQPSEIGSTSTIKALLQMLVDKLEHYKPVIVLIFPLIGEIRAAKRVVALNISENGRVFHLRCAN